MSVVITLPKNLSKTVKATLDKYPMAVDKAMRDMTLYIQKEAKENWARTEDGSPVNPGASANNLKYPTRTLREGVRFITGQLNANIRVLFHKLGGRISKGIVGISEPWYAVEHERFGRHFTRGKYAFIWPAMKYTKEVRKRILETYLKIANRRAA